LELFRRLPLVLSMSICDTHQPDHIRLINRIFYLEYCTRSVLRTSIIYHSVERITVYGVLQQRIVMHVVPSVPGNGFVFPDLFYGGKGSGGGRGFDYFVHSLFSLN